MKLLMTVLMFVLSGCAQLMNGQVQPVIVKDARQNIMFTTCNGASEDWGTCNSKAMKACSSSYLVLEKTENANGGFRSLTFQCKK
jgi:hypothetical protein